jgi:phosphatidylserine/phosphatidylglycerophosphate/cardiolipin synthase-like enzyme
MIHGDELILAVDERRAALVDIIRHARREIVLSLFRCNDEVIFDELAAAVKRGVSVEVLVTARSKGGRKRRQALLRALAKTGATIHTYSDPVVKYHAKYLVADDGPAVVMSLNFTKKCFRKTCDAMVVSYDPAVVAGLRRLIAADRDGRCLPDDLTPRLIVGPERARRQFTDLVAQARTSIKLIDAKLSDPDLVSLLNERRDAGVVVEIVRAKKLGDVRSHGKMMIIDDRLVVIGSLALAALSLDFRREVAIAVDDPIAVADAQQLFQSLRFAQHRGAPVTMAFVSAGGALC